MTRTQRAQTGQAELAQLLDVAHCGVDEHRRDAAALRLRREQLADERDRPRLGHRQHEHLAGLGLGDRGVHHQVVVLAAAHRARRAVRAREPGITCTRSRSTTCERPAASWTVADPSAASSA